MLGLGDSAVPAITSTIIINGGGFAVQRTGGPDFRLFTVNTNGDLTLNNMTISGGRTSGTGYAGSGGGALNHNGILTIHASTITGNYAVTSGGGVASLGDYTLYRERFTTITSSVITNNTAVSGGGIANFYGDMLVMGNVIAENTANAGGGVSGEGVGSEGLVFNLINNTITNNTTTLMGSSIYNHGMRTNVINNTIVNNTSMSYPPAVLLFINGNFTLINNIIAEATTPADCLFYGGSPIQIANNIMVNTCNTSGMEIDFAALDMGAFNGTVFPLGAGSVAIGAGDPAHCPASDQLGSPRKTACDSGAFETPITAEDGTIVAMPAVPPPPTCDATDIPGVVGYDLPDGFYCRELMRGGAWRTHAGTVPSELISNGVILAIDIFSLSGALDFGAHVPVCLPGTGRLIFLDATTSPRTLVELDAFSSDGATCGWIPNAGTLVLIEPE